jgi:hypothetical protein
MGNEDAGVAAAIPAAENAAQVGGIMGTYCTFNIHAYIYIYNLYIYMCIHIFTKVRQVMKLFYKFFP